MFTWLSVLICTYCQLGSDNVKKLVTVAAAIATFGFVNAANAADMPIKAPPMVAAAPVYNWTGFYIGANAGDGWGNGGIDNTATSTFCRPGANCPAAGNAVVAAVPGHFAPGPKGGIGGGQIGYNSQTGAFVWGVETDFQGANINSTSSAANTAPVVGFFPGRQVVTGTGSQKLDWFGTLRGRMGWVPANSLLLYVTGGLAYGHVQTDLSFSVSNPVGGGVGSTTASDSTTRAGWTVGGGLEWMFAPHWSVKGEYLYYDLGHVTLNSTLNEFIAGPTLTTTTGISSEVHYNGSIARAGVNYKF
jgi:outer membrane immunogenic protein